MKTEAKGAQGTLSEHEIAVRLANIEALLVELLDRRKANMRRGVRRSRAVHERLRREASSKPKPSEHHLEMARHFLARR
jgi:hypothetical protein